MVHLMRPADRFKIEIVGVPEQFETLVDEYVVNQEVSQAVKGDSQPYPEQVVETLLPSEVQRQDPGDGEDQEKEVIVLQKPLRFLLVMIFMQRPQESVHDVFVREPGDPLHQAEGAEYYQGIYYNCFHKIILLQTSQVFKTCEV